MPSDATVDKPPTPGPSATPADRQEAARQAYRQSTAAGQPLSGVRLGTMFDRSPRWGVDRIAEVRSDNHRRSNGSHALEGTPPIGNNGNGTQPGAADPQPSHRNGNHPAVPALPNRSNGNDTHSPIASNGSSTNGRTGTNGSARPPITSNGNGTQPAADPQPSRRNANHPAVPALPNRSNGNGTHSPIADDDGRSAPPDEPPEATSSSHRQAGGPGRGVGDRQPQRQARSLLDTVVTLVVAAVAAAASYGHMLDVALMAGEPIWIARAFPVTVDGLVLAALRRGHDGRGWLALGAAMSVAANVLAQFPELAATAGPVVAAWPPLALYGTHRILAGRPPLRRNDARAEGTTR